MLYLAIDQHKNYLTNRIDCSPRATRELAGRRSKDFLVMILFFTADNNLRGNAGVGNRSSCCPAAVRVSPGA